MSRGGPDGAVRVLDGPVPGEPGPPRRSVLIAAAVLAGAALVAMSLSLSGGDGIDASLITDPALQPDPYTSSTVAVEFGDPFPPIATPDPLDVRVPGFEGALVMTIHTGSTLEIWTWGSGSEGTLTRDPVPGNLFDARPDRAGESVAALSRFAYDPPWLVVTDGDDVVPVFYGARSYAWHSTRPGSIAWISQIPGEEHPTLYVGNRDDGGLYFKPLATLPGLDAMEVNRIHDRLVGYDDTGFVIERWSSEETPFAPTVIRLDTTGEPVASLPGTFSGFSPAGELAVSGMESTVIVPRSTTEPSPTAALPMATTSAVWSADGTRLASTPEGGQAVAVGDGARTEATYDVGVSNPTALAWSPDSRFVIVSGHIDDAPVLVFIDTATGSVRPVPIDGYPIGLVVVP